MKKSHNLLSTFETLVLLLILSTALACAHRPSAPSCDKIDPYRVDATATMKLTHDQSGKLGFVLGLQPKEIVVPSCHELHLTILLDSKLDPPPVFPADLDEAVLWPLGGKIPKELDLQPVLDANGFVLREVNRNRGPDPVSYAFTLQVEYKGSTYTSDPTIINSPPGGAGD